VGLLYQTALSEPDRNLTMAETMESAECNRACRLAEDDVQLSFTHLGARLGRQI
jgi:hypothetical protein